MVLAAVRLRCGVAPARAALVVVRLRHAARPPHGGEPFQPHLERAPLHCAPRRRVTIRRSRQPGSDAGEPKLRIGAPPPPVQGCVWAGVQSSLSTRAPTSPFFTWSGGLPTSQPRRAHAPRSLSFCCCLLVSWSRRLPNLRSISAARAGCHAPPPVRVVRNPIRVRGSLRHPASIQ